MRLAALDVLRSRRAIASAVEGARVSCSPPGSESGASAASAAAASAAAASAASANKGARGDVGHLSPYDAVVNATRGSAWSHRPPSTYSSGSETSRRSVVSSEDGLLASSRQGLIA